ncbi:MAG: TraR/DksA family transcriptional regulator [Chlamydiota bacterium]
MPLKKSEVAEYKKRLEQMRDQLTNLIRDSSEEVKTGEEVKGYSQHQADEGTDDFNRTISLQLTSKEFDILRQIERALEKIEEGTYGICDISGEEIPVKRLDAIPYAAMTVKAQEKLEKGLL